MLYGFTVKNNDACFVIDYRQKADKKEKEGKEKEEKEITILSISLYAKDGATYSSIYAPIDLLKEMFKLHNEDPDDHENIHIKMGELMGVSSETTKSSTRHFHWVCKPALSVDDFGGFLLQIKATLGQDVLKAVCKAAVNSFK
jgi:hypothetical protein